MRAATAIAARDRRHQTLRGLGPAVAGDHFARGLAVQAAHQRFVRVGTAREHIDDGLEGERKIQALTRAVALACERPGAQRRLWRSRSGQGHGRLQRVRALQLGAPTSLGKGFEQFACAPWRDLSERVALREKSPSPSIWSSSKASSCEKPMAHSGKARCGIDSWMMRVTRWWRGSAAILQKLFQCRFRAFQNLQEAPICIQ